MYRFSPSNKGFYLEALHGDQIPGDALALTEAQYAELVSGALEHTMLEYRDGQLPVRVPMDVSTPAATERAWRNIELSRSQWVIERHRDEEASASKTTLSQERLEQLLAYRQSLRDWPASKAFPAAAGRPEPLPWLEQLSSHIEHASKK